MSVAGRHLICSTTIVLLVLYLLTVADGAALEGETDNSSDLVHSSVMRIPKVDRKQWSLFTTTTTSTTEKIEDDLVRLPTEDWLLPNWNLTFRKIDTAPFDNNSESNSFKWRVLTIRLIKLGWMLAALALTGWGINRACCAQSSRGAVLVTTGGSELPAPYPAEGLSAMKTPYTLQTSPYPRQAPYPGLHPPYPGQQPPYPGQQPPYPGQQPPYPGQQPPYPGQQPPYPGQQPPYPLQPMPYPGQAPHDSSSVMPHHAQQSPYPCPPNPAPCSPPFTQQTLSTSTVQSLYPPQEATNPYFRMPLPDGGLAVSSAEPNSACSAERKSDHV